MVPNHEASVAKLFSTEMDQRIAATGLKLVAPYGQILKDGSYVAMSGRMPSMYMYATTSTIGGGTSEIQRNIIAQRGLGMPAFRSEVREFLAKELPERFRGIASGGMMMGGGEGGGDVRSRFEELREWRKKLSDKGWIAPAWPKEDGGAG